MTPMWLLPALACLYVVGGQSPCSTPDGKSGDCKSILECEPLRTMANKATLSQTDKNFLKNSLCGFANTIPKVCCPDTSCLTPEFHPGQCISVLDCEHIRNRLITPTQADKDYVESARCSGPPNVYNVCCGTPPNTDPSVEPGCMLTAEPPDPSSECCGLDGSGANKITGGNATGIDQYPWLALIEYKKNDKIKLLCGGVLISGRYVLTAGHCVVGNVLNSGTPTNVRLGEYDTSNTGKDCVPVEGGDPGQVDCTEDVTIIAIDRIIPHPDYNPRNPLRRNDIAMLRMAQTVRYTDFVRPICLPTTDITLKFPETAKLFAAGWGAVTDKISSSSVKLHVDLPFKTLKDCQTAYQVPNRRVALWEKQVCAGGELGKDSCKGDSGGPLMYSTDTFYEVVGIVSFGPTPCGLLNVPGVYTKVFEYISWIRSNIQP